jgi:NTP pyrophosphatase (non-canonical NTP hydrolase)
MSNTFTLQQLQEENRPWTFKNFGKDREPWQPLLGIIEELGELASAHHSYCALLIRNVPDLEPFMRSEEEIDQEETEAFRFLNVQQAFKAGNEVLDAIGDVTVYAADFANMLDFNLDAIKPSDDKLVGTIEISRRLAHSYLKMSQGIRGDKQKHMHVLTDTVARIVHTELVHSCNVLGVGYLDTVQTVWDRVKQRDWSTNKATGGEK